MLNFKMMKWCLIIAVTAIIGSNVSAWCDDSELSALMLIDQMKKTIYDFPEEFEYTAVKVFHVTAEARRLENSQGGNKVERHTELLVSGDKYYAVEHEIPQADNYSRSIFSAWNGRLSQHMAISNDNREYSFSRRRITQIPALDGFWSPFVAYEIFFPKEDRERGVLTPIPANIKLFLNDKNYEVKKFDPSGSLLGKGGMLLEVLAKDSKGEPVSYQILYSGVSRYPKTLIRTYHAHKTRDEFTFSSDAASESDDLKGWLPGEIQFKRYIDDALLVYGSTTIKGLKLPKNIDDGIFTIDPKLATYILDQDNRILIDVNKNKILDIFPDLKSLGK